MLESLPVALMVSAGALLLFSVLGVIQSLTGQKRSGCLSTTLMTISLISFLVFIVQLATNSDEVNTATRSVALGVTGGAILTGIVLALLDRRGDNTPGMMYSRGILSIGTGVLLLVSYLFVPQIPESVFQVPSPTPIAAAIDGNSPDESSAPNIVPTSVAANATSTPANTLMPTITRTPLPMPSPTRTRRAYVPPTPTVTPESVAIAELCGAVVTTNLNVRAEDTVDSAIIAIIPEGARIPLSARNEEGTWWETEFEDEMGWVLGEFLELDPACTVELN